MTADVTECQTCGFSWAGERRYCQCVGDTSDYQVRALRAEAALRSIIKILRHRHDDPGTLAVRLRKIAGTAYPYTMEPT